MVDKLKSLFSSWHGLDEDGKRESLAEIKKDVASERSVSADDSDNEHPSSASQARGGPSSQPEKPADSKQDSLKVYEHVHFYSSASYLYYYPTMHWSMNESPQSDDYWIGIYERGAADDEYLAYYWIGRIANGSYKIGRLKTTAGKEVTNRLDVFELRMFDGSRRFRKASTNNLVGAVLTRALNPYSNKSRSTEDEIDSKKIMKSLHQSTLKDVDEPDADSTTGASKPEETKSEGFMEKLRQSFLSPLERGKLLHLLEQKFLSDEITDEGEEVIDRPEPKSEFADLGKPLAVSAAENTPQGPTRIVLEISLKYCKMYIYPTLSSAAAFRQNKAWLGVYKTSSNAMKFEYKSGNLSGDRKLLRSGSPGERELDSIEESSTAESDTGTCSIDARYVSVIFDKMPGQKKFTQIGFGSTFIHASVYVTQAAEDAKFKADFDIKLAKKCAELSYLAYDPYETIEQKVTEMNLNAEMQIFDRWTDTDGFIASDSTTTVVAFRGTGTKEIPGPLVIPDMVTDFTFLPEPILPGVQDSPSVHSGFLKSLNVVYDSIIDHLKPAFGKKKLIITGHSLGAALASLFVFRLTKEYEDLKSSVTLMTFACPPVGSKEFSDYFEQLNSSTITSQGDIFSSGWLVEIAQNTIEMHKPTTEKFLPLVGGHSMKNYIAQLTSLLED